MISTGQFNSRPRLQRGLLLLIALSAALFQSSCAVNPATGEADIVLMSESRELEIGQESHAKLMASAPIYQDRELQNYVNQIGQKLAANSDRPDLEYTFTIIDSHDINAFALPGGYIYINRGLISYLQSEAQLAAVLAHEIGHVTARHAVRQDAAQKGSKIGTGVLSVLSVLTTGTNVGGELADLYSTAAVRGYGRGMELEADQFGAEYLARSQYDPEAMVEVIGVLKDQENFTRLRAEDRGQKRQTYHGVFATHPRNDQRLRRLVSDAAELAEQSEFESHRVRFRQKTEGMIFGINYEAAMDRAPKPEPNRFTHRNLGFTLLFPEGWDVENRRSAIVAEPDSGAAQLKLEVDRLRSNIPPSEYIRSQLDVPLLTRSEPFSQAGLIGHTGVIPAEGDGHPSRVAVLYQGNRVYIFTGTLNNPQPDVDYDQLFLEAIRSFRPSRTINTSNIKSYKIHYVRANNNTNFAALARLSPLPRYAEEELRLLNGYYPNGEPSPGEWIKIIVK